MSLQLVVEMVTKKPLEELSHTSGFPNWRWFEDDHKLKIHFEPGSRYAYSGEGMQARVFQPFGMTRSSMVWQDGFESDYANGYDEYERSLGPQKRTTADAAGSMRTTVTDFARFQHAVVSKYSIFLKRQEITGA